MTDLIKIENIEFAPNLTPGETLIVKASHSLRLSEVVDVDFCDKITDHINEALVILGHSKKITDVDISIMSKLVTDQLLRAFPNYRTEEIKCAIRNGAFGEYGEDVVFVSANNILKWCKLYQESKNETLVKQLKYDNEKKEDQKQELENRKHKRYWCELVYRIREDYLFHKWGKPLSPSAWVYFNSLCTIGVINLDNETKRNKFKEVKERIVKDNNERYVKIEMSSVLDVSRNECRIFFYKEYLESITKWSKEKAFIVEKVDLSELF